jgi:ABC-type sugar transport system permease subunit
MFMLFLIIPAVLGFLVSFTDYTGLSPKYNFVGLTNYKNMFSDRYIIRALQNNFVYALIYTPATLLLSLLLATVLNHLRWLKKIFRTVIFLPYITSMVAVAVIWKMIFNPLDGPLNTMLSIFIKEPPEWIVSSKWALYAVIVVAVWKSCGYYMLIFLAGMQNIPNSLYESASLDGAGNFHQYFFITLPMLSPTIFLNVVLVIMNSFQVFDLVNVMTNGGPGMSTNVLVLRIYQEAFKSSRMGYSSAIAYFLFGIILFITLIQFILQKRWVHYE